MVFGAHYDTTCLHTYASRGNLALVKILLEKGADPTVSVASGFTPIREAANYRHDNVVAYLLQKDPASATKADRNGYLSIHAAAACGSLPLRTMRHLLDAGADPNCSSLDGTQATPLHLCSYLRTTRNGCGPFSDSS
jgi:ankyrin repeat protein